jgi:Fe-S cluster assembly protein SufD
VAALGGPEWLRVLRHDAFDRFAAGPLPTDADEVWRYSRIDKLDLDRFSVASPAQPEAADAVLPPSLSRALSGAGAMVTIRNGRSVTFDLEHPSVAIARPDDHPWTLGDIAGEPDALVSLNAALAGAPLRVSIAKGAVVDGPVVIVHWTDVPDAAVFPRILVRAEPGCEATVVEIVASGADPALVVPVTEVDVADTANLRYLNLQILGSNAWQIGLQRSRVGRDATFVSASVAFGGDYARIRTDSALVGQGGSSRLLAAYFGRGDQMHDFRTVQDHRARKTTSELVFKGAVANRSRSVYSGMIRVEKGAVGSSAFQANRNLVLGEGAHADSVPNLEIEENDVRCTHASAVGPIDEEQRFYLESKGVPPEVTDRLIVRGFLDEVLTQAPAPALLPWLRETLATELAQAEAAGLAEAGAAGL